MTAKFDALCLRNRTNLESREARTSEGQHVIRELRITAMQLKTSVVPPNLTTDLDAMVGSQKYEIQSRQTNLLTTQDSFEQLG